MAKKIEHKFNSCTPESCVYHQSHYDGDVQGCSLSNRRIKRIEPSKAEDGFPTWCELEEADTPTELEMEALERVRWMATMSLSSDFPELYAKFTEVYGVLVEVRDLPFPGREKQEGKRKKGRKKG